MNDEPGELFVRHLLVCEVVEYDPDNPRAPYSACGILDTLRPQFGEGFPMANPELWVFVQFYGDPGEFDIWQDLVRLDLDAETEDEVAGFGPWLVRVTDPMFVTNRGWQLARVPFPEPGVYEFRLRVGVDTRAVERVMVEE